MSEKTDLPNVSMTNTKKELLEVFRGVGHGNIRKIGILGHDTTPIVELLKCSFTHPIPFRIAEAGFVVKVNIVGGVHGFKDFKTCCCQYSL